MKRVFAVFLSLCLTLAALPTAFAAACVSVDSTWTVLLPEDPTSYESFTAKKLSSCLGEVFDADVKIVDEPDGHYIAVGSA